MQRVLLVDDDRLLCEMLCRYLAEEGFDCVAAHDGHAALERLAGGGFNAVVLDVMLPKANGFEVLRRLRQVDAIPVLMLTAWSEEEASIVGLEIGADDYLAKPCNPKVLAARLRAVLRRTATGSATEPRALLTINGVTLHSGARQVKVAGEEKILTSAEFNILELLMKEAGRVVDKETLALHGLGRKLAPYDRSIDLHISALRRKLGHGQSTASPIRTIRGSGYFFALSDKE